MAATCGTTPLNVTCSRKSAPAAANVEPEDDWMRAPAESSSHTIGMRWRSASSRIRDVFDSPMAPIDPASTVKSYAQIATLRPSMAPMPATIPSAARYPRSAWSTGSIESASMTELDEGPGIEQQVEPLPHGQLAHAALPLDHLGPAHGASGVAPDPEVVDERAPVEQVRLVSHAPASITETHNGRRGGAH